MALSAVSAERPGTLSKPQENQPLQIALNEMIPWRDTIWWGTVKAIGATQDFSNSTTWRHHNSFANPGIAWDNIFIKVYGDDWRRTMTSIEKESIVERDFFAPTLISISIRQKGKPPTRSSRRRCASVRLRSHGNWNHLQSPKPGHHEKDLIVLCHSLSCSLNLFEQPVKSMLRPH
jgi:hypothetical protein